MTAITKTAAMTIRVMVSAMDGDLPSV
jgi:hypothetical protein